MLSNRAAIALPLVMISMGVGALLTTLGVVPKIDWIWTFGLALAGFVTWIMVGIDRVTFVVGSLFMVMCALSVFRQLDILRMDIEIPVLIIACGVLMILARHPKLPNPKWLE
jgi:hypothetical protein